MDRICAWNVRGLNWPNKPEDLKLFLNKQHVGLMALLETKIKPGNFDSIAAKVAPGWCSSHNFHYNPNGRIWVTWKPSIFHVQTLDASDQYIHCRVQQFQPSTIFYLTIVYGHNHADARQSLWEDLCRIGQAMNEA